MIFEYRLSEMKKWLQKLSDRHLCGCVIGLPKAGINRTINEAIQSLGWDESFLEINPALFGNTLKSRKQSINTIFSPKDNVPPNIIYLRGLDLSKKIDRLTLKYLAYYRKKHANRFIYILDVNQDLATIWEKIRGKVYIDWFWEKFYFPYADNDEIDILITQNESRFDLKIDTSTRKDLAVRTGGIPYLIKIYFQTLATDAKQLQNNLEVTGEYIWREIVKHNIVKFKEPDHRITNIPPDSLFLRCGLTDSDGEIRSSVIKEVSKKKTGLFKLEVKNNAFMVNGQDLDDQLSWGELEFLKNIVTQGKLSRDDTAKYLLGNSTADYSDYALDKSVSRLRQKFHSLGLSSAIVTQRGFGYKINQHD